MPTKKWGSVLLLVALSAVVCFNLSIMVSLEVKKESDMDTWVPLGDYGRPIRIAYITFTHLNGTQRFQEMIIGSVETWLPPKEVYFVVMSSMWKETYEEALRTNSSFLSSHARRIEPLFVNCPEGKFGESPCCKQQEGLLEMIRRGYLSRYEWFVFMDDDVYLRDGFLRDYLGQLSHQQPVVLAGGMPPKRLGQSGYKTRRRTPYNCSNDPNYTYPHGQPAVYSRAALQRIRNALELGGLVRQCREFGLTHDSGNALLHWMHSLDEIWFRIGDRPDSFRNYYLGSHGVGRCRAGRACPMRWVHNIYTGLPSMHPPNRSNYTYRWHRVNGFRSTRTYQEHGDPSKWTSWHTMPTEDCAGV